VSQSQYQSLALQKSKAFNNFINALKSPKTRIGYVSALRRYLKHLKITEVDDLLLNSRNPKLIESQIIDYIMTLRDDGLAYATITFLIAPIITFYALNDVVLNTRKISKYYGEYKKVVKDRAYTQEEIYKALQTADQRMKVIILLMLSTGERIGSLPELTLGNLTRNAEGNYKIVIYEGTNNEYYTFTTRECASAIDDYIAYRQRCGERISFNNVNKKWEPENSPLLRRQFDVKDSLQARHPLPMKNSSIRNLLDYHLVRCGIRTVEHPIANPNTAKRIRKQVPLGNGFRKFAISSFIRAGLNHEIREMLVDHATQLDQNYFRPSEEEVLSEYLKAEPYLTLDPSVRLSQENRILTMDRNKLESRLERLEQACKDFL
jgi:integrase